MQDIDVHGGILLYIRSGTKTGRTRLVDKVGALGTAVCHGRPTGQSIGRSGHLAVTSSTCSCRELAAKYRRLTVISKVCSVRTKA